MVDIEIKMEEEEVIDVTITQGPSIEVDLSSTTELSVEVAGSGPRGRDGIGVPPGGTSGQVLSKDSDNDYDCIWTDPSQSYPVGGQIGDILTKTSNDPNGVAWQTPASSAEADNTRPITAAAVYTEIGNINALLATI